MKITFTHPSITPMKLREILLTICDKQTSFDPGRWTPSNPLYGHCAVASLIAQDLFGGDLLSASLLNTPFSSMECHFWNQFPDGTQEDFTKEQFGGNYPKDLKTDLVDRVKILEYIETASRYSLLKARLERYLKKAEY